MSASHAAATAAPPSLSITHSRRFPAWLASEGLSLAFTTYQAGKVFFIGLTPDEQVSVFERTFARSMGLAAVGNSLWLATLYQIWRFENFMGGDADGQGYDALYVPMEGRTTGDIDVHDVAVSADGKPLFVVTRFNCIAELDDTSSFRPIWKPPFIDRIAAEDRCHLNGMALEDGELAYASAVGRSNVAEGWRDQRADGGVILDTRSGEIVAGGLSMPHSPRLHNGDLWALNAGTGEFGRVDRKAGRFEPLAFCRGFTRGLDLHGNYAVAGASLPRHGGSFSGLALENRLQSEGLGAKCSVSVINLTTGDVEHSLQIEGVVEELYDVVLLKGIRRPKALGFKTDEIHNAIRISAN
ncbi:MAG: TIGR03032 family protein [Pseudomonadota bacterium]